MDSIDAFPENQQAQGSTIAAMSHYKPGPGVAPDIAMAASPGQPEAIIAGIMEMLATASRAG